MDSSTRSTLIIAGAIVFAGLIIAAGVLFGNTDGSQNAPGNDQQPTKTAGIAAAAAAAGVDSAQVQSCLDAGKFKSSIENEMKDARSAIDQRIGTPFNILILANPLTSKARSQISSQLGDNITISEDGKRLAVGGAVPLQPLQQIIDTALSGQTSSGDRSSDDLAVKPVSEEDHIRGSSTAKVTVVEYSDFECPYCQQFHQTMKQILEAYEDDQVAWVFRHMPIQQLHPQAPRLARASECVADIGGEDAFWTFADELFSGP